MNDNTSTTAKAERLSDTKRLEYRWKHIDWKKAEYEVNRLQVRIAKATRKKNWNAVKKTAISDNAFVLCKITGCPQGDNQQREKHVGRRQRAMVNSRF